MKITFFTHPKFLGSQSMPRYAKMLAEGMKNKGYEVAVWYPKPLFFYLPFNAIKKWLGYIDQYIVFPLVVRLKLLKVAKDTLFVFSDQALGPWVPFVKNKPHVIHCHDFLALNSALGNVPENPTGKTGKIYQNFIRKGFSKGKHFISISKKTKEDLHQFHTGIIESSVVCYNGLNRKFEPLDMTTSRSELGTYLNLDLSKGYILHVGGNQFYKNRKGVVELYSAWRAYQGVSLPLLMVGAKPSKELKAAYEKSSFKSDIHFVIGLEDDYINKAYSGATCLLFPSLDEGFGWPIAEALASGCLVITTNKAPMIEVAGIANHFLIDRRPFDETLVDQWAVKASATISSIIQLSDNERLECVKIGLETIKRFDVDHFLNELERQYLSIVEKNNI